MQNRRLLIIGEVFVDFHLDIKHNEQEILRLGGIFHAMRASAALDIEYACAFYAPSYLYKDIEKYSQVLKAKSVNQLGEIDKAPNVFLINGSDESGKQSYTNILSGQTEYLEYNNIRDIMNEFQPTDVMVFPGRYNVGSIFNELYEHEARIHVDIGYDSEQVKDYINEKVNTLFLSTSTTTYKEYFYGEDYQRLIEHFRDKKIKQLLIKENRGGSWLYDYVRDERHCAPAYKDKTIHSVGVGDVYNIFYIYDRFDGLITKNMCLASWAAVLYSSSLHYDYFKNNIASLLEFADEQVELEGIRVPWFSRQKYNIYMAAPDFDYINCEKLDDLVSSLEYHNFIPRLPIRENGQVSDEMDYNEKMQLYSKDYALLDECDFMIATLLCNDQGTLVEIGMYRNANKPIVLYDPYQIAKNLFLEFSCDYHCKEKSDVINSIFEIVSGLENKDE